MLKIIFYGRGGQGAKTAAHIFALAGFIEGKNVQAFPEYGPERSGAPMRTFVKISKKAIWDYAPITKADYVVVIDASLLMLPDMREKILGSLKKKGTLIVNASRPIEGVKAKYVDVSGLSKKLGRDLSNIGLLGVLAKFSGIVGLDSLMKAVEQTLAAKPQWIEPNKMILKEAYGLVIG